MKPETLMAEVLAEAERFDQLQEMGNYSASPFSPEAVAQRFTELGEAAVPYLVAMIGEERRETKWALVALEALGPVAKAAGDALARRVANDEWTASTLFCVDPDRALAMGLHRQPSTYRMLCNRGFMHGPEWFARVASELLGDPDPALVRLAFSSGQSLSANLVRLAKTAPALVPVSLVRKHARHPDREIAQAACRVLGALRDPDDAARVLERIDRLWGLVDWLGPLRGSERFAGTLGLVELYELLRRRRCAGLSNVAINHRAALAKVKAKAPFLHELPMLARIVRETRDAEAMRELPALAENHYAWDADDPVVLALAMFGDEGRAAVEAVRREAKGALLKNVANLEAKLSAWKRPDWLALGDLDFIAGRIAPNHHEQGQHVDTGAWAAYALALLDDPKCAYAAVQLAWIDRSHGTPITSERSAWLRGLGANDETLLAELVTKGPTGVTDKTARERHVLRVRISCAPGL